MTNRITESPSQYNDLEQMRIRELLVSINREDHKVPKAVAAAIPQIEQLVEQVVPRMESGGRLFYLGAGTSGRLGIVDASECPPTFGVPHDWVIGLIAGGDDAIVPDPDPGQHLDLIGAYRADMREADDAVLGRARIFVDSFETTIEHIGELKDPLARGVIARSDVLGDLHDLVEGRAGRRSPEEITIFKNGGGAHLDLMVGREILAAWRDT